MTWSFACTKIEEKWNQSAEWKQGVPSHWSPVEAGVYPTRSFRVEQSALTQLEAARRSPNCVPRQLTSRGGIPSHPLQCSGRGVWAQVGVKEGGEA